MHAYQIERRWREVESQLQALRELRVVQDSRSHPLFSSCKRHSRRTCARLTAQLSMSDKTPTSILTFCFAAPAASRFARQLVIA